MEPNRTECKCCRCRNVETTLESGGFEYRVACDARAWREGDRRRETATGMAMKSASAKSLVSGLSQVRAVTCHLNDAEKREASEQSK
jgi:hypothetical protein